MSTDNHYDHDGMYQYREPGDVKLGTILRLILATLFVGGMGVLLGTIARGDQGTLTIPVTGDVVRELQAATLQLTVPAAPTAPPPAAVRSSSPGCPGGACYAPQPAQRQRVQRRWYPGKWMGR